MRGEPFGRRGGREVLPGSPRIQGSHLPSNRRDLLLSVRDRTGESGHLLTQHHRPIKLGGSAAVVAQHASRIRLEPAGNNGRLALNPPRHKRYGAGGESAAGVQGADGCGVDEDHVAHVEGDRGAAGGQMSSDEVLPGDCAVGEVVGRGLTTAAAPELLGPGTGVTGGGTGVGGLATEPICDGSALFGAVARLLGVGAPFEGAPTGVRDVIHVFRRPSVDVGGKPGRWWTSLCG
ncbi:hypothetical protein [Couchioplanes azureus]|uniref:hypothetical protein n=1 Tax=Couchioplanes caeruleus TaxID=56438 RepID=UPI001670424E|nr:hypothetical protein [Couchioplanes caeruleus]